MPEQFRPMLATPGPLPEAAGWAFEFKWDGVRAITEAAGGRVRVITRNGREVASTYPEVEALADLGVDAVLDGELVALDSQGRPRFGLLQSRMHVSRPSRELLDRVPVDYYVFDLLGLDGKATTGLTYAQRRELLDQLRPAELPHVELPPSFTGVTGDQVLSAAREHGLEGVVAKQVDSTYEPGRRSPAWIKVPLVRTQEVLIGGWRPGAGRRQGTVGSLLLGAYRDGPLCYLGHVGTGFTDAALRELHAQLVPLSREDSPFTTVLPREHLRDAHWVEPVLVGEVEYRQLTEDGMLRHASWRGLRTDKDPAEVRFSPPRR